MKIKPLDTVDIALSIFNQENLIEKVLEGIFKNTTTPFNLILVFDGCTDQTKPKALKYIKENPPKLLREFISRDANNVFETKANNIAFKLVTSEYFVTLQDDMVIKEKGWERRITYPLRKYDDVLAVTARIAHDIDKMDENNQTYKNKAAREYKTLKRNVFAVRDIINRGPVAFRTEYLKKLNFLNESYAPAYLDEADLSLRAWELYKWKVGSFWIDYTSRIEWGKTRSAESGMKMSESATRNQARLGNDHRAYIDSGEKHDEDLIIEESEIDYINKPFLKNTRKYIGLFVHEIGRIVVKLGFGTMSISKFLWKPEREIEVAKRGERDKPWHAVNGDTTLRLNYEDLNENSVVFDLGGFKGEWAIEILARYNPKELYIFEPVKKFADDIQKRFIKNSRVKVFAFGLGNKDFTEEIAVENASTSVYKKDQGSKEKIEIKDIKKFLEEKNIDKIDLMKINIEGGEYDLLEYLIENTLIQKIKNIQIQFHDFVPGAHNKMERIRNGLSKTHSPTYKYDFIWENWRLK